MQSNPSRTCPPWVGLQTTLSHFLAPRLFESAGREARREAGKPLIEKAAGLRMESAARQCVDPFVIVK